MMMIRSRVLAGLLAAAVLPAWSQPVQRTFDDFVLRSSVVSSHSIPEESAARYGIKRSSRTGILNITVLATGSGLMSTIPARVEASITNLAGMRRPVRLQENVLDGWVSYSGTFNVTPPEVLDFHIRARPAGTDRDLHMSFRRTVQAREPVGAAD